jgi:hypothetical protein
MIKGKATVSPNAAGLHNKVKVHITFLNFHESLLFLFELQNRTKHISQLLKLFILPP